MIAIYGGAFDPPHLGHRDVLQELIQSSEFKAVWVIPTGHSSFRPLTESPAHRFLLASTAFRSMEKVEVLDVESSSAEDSTTFHTLDRLRSRSHEPYSVVLGSDQLWKLNKWFRFPEVLSKAHWRILERKELPSLSRTSLEEAGIPYRDQARFQILQTEARAASSTEIRASWAQGNPLAHPHLDPKVVELIEKEGFYGWTSSSLPRSKT